MSPGTRPGSEGAVIPSKNNHFASSPQLVASAKFWDLLWDATFSFRFRFVSRTFPFRYFFSAKMPPRKRKKSAAEKRRETKERNKAAIEALVTARKEKSTPAKANSLLAAMVRHKQDAVGNDIVLQATDEVEGWLPVHLEVLEDIEKDYAGLKVGNDANYSGKHKDIVWKFEIESTMRGTPIGYRGPAFGRTHDMKLWNTYAQPFRHAVEEFGLAGKGYELPIVSLPTIGSKANRGKLSLSPKTMTTFVMKTVTTNTQMKKVRLSLTNRRLHLKRTSGSFGADAKGSTPS